MKILILRFSSIGDIVLTSPIIRCLRLQKPETEIHYCTKKQFSFLIETNPYIDKAIYLEGSINDLIKKLKAEKYDYIIDLHNNLRTFRVKKALKTKAFSFNKLNYEKWLYVNFKINKLPNVHIVDRYLETVKSLGVINDEEGLDYFIPEKDEVEWEWLPETHQKTFIAFAIGGGHSTKKLPLVKMLELCDKINKPIVLLGGKEDTETGEKIADFFQKPEENSETEALLKELNRKTVIYNACGKYNFNQSADLIRKSRVVFSHDTGLMHVAAAFKKKVYSIWGNTTPYYGMYPYQTEFVVFENNNLPCRSCSKIGFDRCPKKHFKCMNDLKFDFYIP